MKFGNVDINTDLDWGTWSWEEFIGFFNTSVKPHTTDTPEKVAKALGVPIPKPDKGGSA